MRQLIPLLMGLFLSMGCTSTGASSIQIVTHSEGSTTIATDLNLVVAITDGQGYAVIRAASPSPNSPTAIVPLFVKTFDKAGSWVWSMGDGTEMFLEKGEPFPSMLEPSIRALFTTEEITQLGIKFEGQ